jgi:hypothetical protein
LRQAIAFAKDKSILTCQTKTADAGCRCNFQYTIDDPNYNADKRQISFTWHRIGYHDRGSGYPWDGSIRRDGRVRNWRVAADMKGADQSRMGTMPDGTQGVTDLLAKPSHRDGRGKSPLVLTDREIRIMARHFLSVGFAVPSHKQVIRETSVRNRV